MQKSKMNIFFRRTIYIVELIFCYILEQVLATSLDIGNLYIFLLIPAFVSVALFESEGMGLACGIFAGILVDYGYGQGIGLTAVLLAALGYVLGVVFNYFLASNVLYQIAFSTVIVLIVEGTRAFFVWHDMISFLSVTQRIVLPSLLISLPCFVLIFYFNRAISHKFCGEEENAH